MGHFSCLTEFMPPQWREYIPIRFLRRRVRRKKHFSRSGASTPGYSQPGVGAERSANSLVQKGMPFCTKCSLGDLERSRHGGRDIVAAQNHHGHDVAARLCGRRRGAGIWLPLAGKAGVQHMDAALIRCGHAVHRQLSHKVGIRGVGGGDLADILLPDELGLVGLEHDGAGKAAVRHGH